MAARLGTTGKFVQDLTCPICLDIYKDPVTLECGHNYCKPCIDKFWGSQLVPSCPECRVTFFDGRYVFNRALASMAETAQNLNLGPIRGGPEQPCLDHNETLKLFCKEDETPICVMCVVSAKHAGHSFIPLQEAVSIYQDKLRTASSPLKSRLKELNELQIKQEQKISAIEEKSRSLGQHITSEFAKLHQFLHDKEQQLLQKLKEEVAGILRRMEENLKSIQKESIAILETLSNIQSRMGQQDCLPFLTGLKDFTEKFCEVPKKATQSNTVLVTHELALGVYKGPLQYSVWKEMSSIISPALSSLTLNPDTAHPNLILSEDLTSVWDGGRRQQLPDNPERFDTCGVVLGSEGFTSGRHYWEVEVGEIYFDLGLARESIKRKGEISASPRSGIWIMVLRNGGAYEAFDTKAKVICLDKKPRRIGVYLDYEGGQVSFYNADDMSHLYTFSHTFTERLYPLLSPGCPVHSEPNSEPLKLFHLKL